MISSLLSRFVERGLALLEAAGMCFFPGEGAFVEGGEGGPASGLPVPVPARTCRSWPISDFAPTA